jgi:ankyrin repeat protein
MDHLRRRPPTSNFPPTTINRPTQGATLHVQMPLCLLLILVAATFSHDHCNNTSNKCAPGSWFNESITICSKCTPIAGATNNATFTCTNANNTRFTSGYIEDSQLFFLSKGVQIDNATNQTPLPLYVASELGKVNALNVLLSVKNIQINQAMDDGATPLFIACQKNRVEIVRMLISHNDININQAMHNGGTPLFIASEKGNVQVLYLLMSSKNIDMNPTLKDGGTPLFIAAQNGHMNAVYALLSHPETHVNRATKDGASAIFVAAQNGHTKVVQALLSKEHTHINAAMKDGATPLFIAAQNNHMAVVKLLTATTGIELNRASSAGATPLYIACEMGHVAIVKLLLACPGININKALHDGRTPLMRATQLGRDKIVRLLQDASTSDVTKHACFDPIASDELSIFSTTKQRNLFKLLVLPRAFLDGVCSFIPDLVREVKKRNWFVLYTDEIKSNDIQQDIFEATGKTVLPHVLVFYIAKKHQIFPHWSKENLRTLDNTEIFYIIEDIHYPIDKEVLKVSVVVFFAAIDHRHYEQYRL